MFRRTASVCNSPPPAVGDAAMTTNSFTFTWNALSGQFYQVQRSTRSEFDQLGQLE